MKRTFVIIAVALLAITTITSCASSRGMNKGGCKGTQGFIGYGSR